MFHQAIKSPASSHLAFDPAGLERLAELYPLMPGKLPHGLVGHPLLTLDALADASMRMNPAHVECRQAENRNGEEFAFAESPEATVGETVRNIAGSGRWVMLRFAEQLPEYDALLREVVGEIEPVVRARTGEALRLRAFIFVSSPGALTPFHFDPEYNILFQIAGRKFFAVYPPEGPWLGELANERYHAEGENLLPWIESFAESGAVHLLDPGDALFVPYRSPHWVEVGEEPSISISLTWSTRAGYEQDDAYRFNAWLRRRGFAPRAPQPMPERSLAKAYAYRLLRKLHLA